MTPNSKEIKVIRDEDGIWWNERGNRCFVGEDAAVLDKLFGREENKDDTDR